MIAALREWAAGQPVLLVVALALVAFFALLAGLLVAGVALGTACARLGAGRVPRGGRSPRG